MHCCTKMGQDVWLVGSHPCLGAWDLEKALPLSWTVGRGGGWEGRGEGRKGLG